MARALRLGLFVDFLVLIWYKYIDNHQYIMKSCFNCFRALNDKNRVKVVSALLAGSQNVSSLTKMLGISQPTVSYHLDKLKKEKIVKAKKVGREVFYYFNKKYACPSCRVFESTREWHI